MKLSSAVLVAGAQADNRTGIIQIAVWLILLLKTVLWQDKNVFQDYYGTCVKDERSSRVLPVYFGETNSVEECLAGCRSIEPRGYPYAGLEYKTECYCGDEPEKGFDSLYTWPDRCNMRCQGNEAVWQNCGGAGAMNVWSVPPNANSDLGGLCVYDHPKDGRVFNGPAEIGNKNLTIASCKNYCMNQGHDLENESSLLII